MEGIQPKFTKFGVRKSKVISKTARLKMVCVQKLQKVLRNAHTNEGIKQAWMELIKTKVDLNYAVQVSEIKELEKWSKLISSTERRKKMDLLVVQKKSAKSGPITS